MAIPTNPHSGYFSKPTNIVTHDVMIFDNRAYKIHKVVVYQFRIGDVEDPDLYAGEPLIEWQNSEMGKWVMERAVDTPEWHRNTNIIGYYFEYAVVAKLKDVDYTFWTLKWGSK